MGTYYIKHSYKEDVILPLCGIADNVNFLFDDEEKFVKTSDGIKARLIDCKELHIVELEKDIQEIYKIDAWSFLKKWYNANNGMQSARFLKLKLKQL
jgi:hypothetical protein